MPAATPRLYFQPLCQHEVNFDNRTFYTFGLSYKVCSKTQRQAKNIFKAYIFLSEAIR